VYKPTIALLAAVAALVLIASGCGGSYGSDDSAASSGGGRPDIRAYGGGVVAKPADPVAVAGVAKAVKVSVGDNVFQPNTIHAKVGQKITWSQDGQIAHTVTATEGAKFDSGPLNPGAKFSYVAKKAGTIQYLCQFHQGMVGTIVVD
jgi:plastocyanin